MLSYQHGFHAGNLADVHKHALLAWALAYMTAKDKPLSYIETHAGRGLYRLDDAMALKTGEAAQGIGRAEGWFDADHPYTRVLTAVRAAHGGMAYPGSPLVAAMSLRATDRMRLAELHPQEVAALRETFAGHDAVIEQRDGLEMALATVPPTPRRGLMLIDPSWEVKADYETIPKLLVQVARRWPVGVLMLWYPILEGAPHAPMLRTLMAAFPDALSHAVRFAPARPGHRMTGSGLFIVNPPYGLAQEAARLSPLFAALPAQS
ncbi:MAG: 23S rRNA (adenine(2030)-N(6))-methyltransferase RlmJ [Limimaricola sp.]|uniref:23S rRNA (adenine(2030)-N(6))-methyltransferase RlmJ n=1 Tax=Limimaricola sp. TaxID=2211665 RepID=UPI001D21D248|nr:23S rRNA (adenine(2030)-N(6))-methyltransferase RlmJ [Limimaricola sp.]MBI1416537.1 23S rRNA (adenine(2030)-N(6))-methyltransferase RlmJ [Limimaricola sp.]